MGTVTILMHLSFVAVQAALLKRQFRPAHLLQIPIVFIFGILTDFSMWLMAPLEPDGYLWSVILCLFSCVVIGFGVFLQVKADSVLLAGEGMSLAFVKLFKWEFGAVKTGMDCTLVCIGLACSFFLLHGLSGIREGTVVAAILVGVFVFSHYLFASTTAHISAMMLAFLTVGAQLIPADYVVPFMLMMTAGSAIMMTLTHYATGTSPIIFGSGFVTMGNWWRVGFIMCVVELLIFAVVGTTWWKVLGYW